MDTKLYGYINGLHGGNYPEVGSKKILSKAYPFNVDQTTPGTNTALTAT